MNRGIIFLWIILSVHSIISEDVSLYGPDDDVLLLNITNFKSTLSDSRRNNAWAVEFFSSWCGHCKRFAPTWKEIADNAKGWHNVLIIAAIDCAVKENLPLCREYGIVGYPTIRMFPPHSRENGTDLGKSNLVHEMIDFVENISASNRPQSWPSLHLLRSIDQIWKQAENQDIFRCIIFEDRGSYIGREVILDTSSFENLVVRRMMSSEAEKFALKSFPNALIVESDGTFKELDGDNTRAGILSSLSELTGNKLPEGRISSHLQDHSADVTAYKKLKNPDGVHMNDLLAGLSYSLTQEIAGLNVIDGSRFQALKLYINVLSKYFPGPDSVTKFLGKLSLSLEEEKDSILGATFSQLLKSLTDNTSYIPKTKGWTGCEGSEPTLRGYPCSLWTIFHSLTVNKCLTSSDEDNDDEAAEVLHAMRAYISSFFGCRECAENFEKMAVNIDDEVDDQESAVLWLWRAHNQANERLHGDPSEDPQHPKIQFPSKQMCSACYDSQGDFDQNGVLTFLELFFSKDHIIQDADLREDEPLDMRVGSDEPQSPKLRPNNSSQEKARSISFSLFFTDTDYRLCFAFYFICFLIIFAACWIFLNKRRKYGKKQNFKYVV